ncbi:hypothetical protein EZS27_004094 [termite gut metagenome]|uniref:Uncharacterized protein n=1 Tax=termite gut metagenome TaxID=433724 RepID=A0A5J4SQQ6_9ZZZZ
MITYEVGKPFPLPKYLNRGESTVAILNESFFDLFVSLHGITSNENNAFRKGKLTIFLYENKSVPFIICDFGNNFSFDVSIDITKMNKDQQEKWLNSDVNLISLYLVDAATGILQAMRTITINFAEDIKDICERQSEFDSVQDAINETLEKNNTADMIKKSKKRMTYL